MTCLKDLIEALRGELQQYGEMLARFDDADANNMQPTAEEAQVRVKALQEQAGVVEMALRRREKVQRQFARYLCLPGGACLTDIIPLLPRQQQLLVRALMDENQELSVRVQRRANRKRQLPRRPLPRMEGWLVAA